MVMAVGTNWRLGAKLFRHLRRAALAAPTKFKGPWTVAAFKAAFPVVAAKILRATDKDGNHIGPERLPLVWAGEDAVAQLATDYAPTDADCTNDVEPPEPEPEVP
jgi:hypothetical protein